MATVTIYSTVTCPWCDKAKEWMASEGIAYEEIDVTTDSEKQQELIALTQQRTVPVIARDGEFVVGFDPAKIRALASAS
ncbi:MAG: Glutaredoxin 3 [bacterium]|nr:Glutaredoxin 3 [bacterium]